MFEPRPGRARPADSTLDLARRTAVAPGRSTGMPGIVMKPREAEEESVAKAKTISADEGAAMEDAIEAAPRIDADEERGDGDRDDDDDDDEPVAVAAKRKVPPPPKDARSAFATEHEKVMRNYGYKKKGTLITNTTDREYKPNRRSKEIKKLPGKETSKILNTISVDIGTVIGGSRKNNFANGWVLVFKTTYIKRGKTKAKVPSGDHTGWIRVKRLAGDARKALAAYQIPLRKRLRKGKGAGHAAKLEKTKRTFDVQGDKKLGDKDFVIQGGGGTTPLANYTLNRKRYGDVIIGVWNPPGSGNAKERFSGSGGIRAFFPRTQEFQLATEAGEVEIQDIAGGGRSYWRYVGAELNGETIYCWLLQRWQTGGGEAGQNFAV